MTKALWLDAFDLRRTTQGVRKIRTPIGLEFAGGPNQHRGAEVVCQTGMGRMFEMGQLHQALRECVLGSEHIMARIQVVWHLGDKVYGVPSFPRRCQSATMGSLGHQVDFDALGSKVLSPQSLCHVVLRTSNLKKMVGFYVEFLGGRIAIANDFIAFVSYDEEHHRVAIVEVPGTNPKNSQTCGLEHMAFGFSTLSDLLLAYRQRLEAGIKPFWCVNHGPTTSIYYKDPDGNMVETQVDNFDTAAEADKFMSSDLFRANPIGTEFDPEDMIERIKRGESDTSLKRRVETGSRGLDLSVMA